MKENLGTILWAIVCTIMGIFCLAMDIIVALPIFLAMGWFPLVMILLNENVQKNKSAKEAQERLTIQNIVLARKNNICKAVDELFGTLSIELTEKQKQAIKTDCINYVFVVPKEERQSLITIKPYCDVCLVSSPEECYSIIEAITRYHWIGVDQIIKQVESEYYNEGYADLNSVKRSMFYYLSEQTELGADLTLNDLKLYIIVTLPSYRTAHYHYKETYIPTAMRVPAIFERNFQKISYQLNDSHNYHPITAAYLYFISDITFMKRDTERRANAQTIFSFLQKFLSPAELSIFDQCISIFANIANGVIPVRGDWLLEKDDDNDWFYRCFLCFGDLLQNPSYITNYSQAPSPTQDIDITIDFTLKMHSLLPSLVEYEKELTNALIRLEQNENR